MLSSVAIVTVAAFGFSAEAFPGNGNARVVMYQPTIGGQITGSNLSGANFNGSSMLGIRFTETNLTALLFRELKVRELDLRRQFFCVRISLIHDLMGPFSPI